MTALSGIFEIVFFSDNDFGWRAAVLADAAASLSSPFLANPGCVEGIGGFSGACKVRLTGLILSAVG
jgi:hypothetical protein